MTGMSVQVQGLVKVYRKGSESLRVLDGASIDIKSGERAAILGPSGCGKTTLMHLLGLLDRPSEGQILLDGTEVGGLRDAARDRIRNTRIGFVFQSHNLLPEHDALANVMVPALLCGMSWADARVRAEALLAAVGLSHRVGHQPAELSGGEQQRVAIARALVMGPGLLLADEPTGNLDPNTAAGVFSLLMDLHAQVGSTLIVVTHSERLADQFPRRLSYLDGRFVAA